MKKNKIDLHITEREILLENYYILPVYNKSNFKLKFLDLMGDVEIEYKYSDFLYKNDFLEDIISKFKEKMNLRLLNRFNTIISSNIPLKDNVDKKEDVFDIISIKQRKQNIKNILKNKNLYIVS